jgi:hypothetical protein
LQSGRTAFPALRRTGSEGEARKGSTAPQTAKAVRASPSNDSRDVACSARWPSAYALGADAGVVWAPPCLSYAFYMEHR